MINSETKELLDSLIENTFNVSPNVIYISVLVFILLSIVFLILLYKLLKTENIIFEVDFTKEIKIKVTESGEIIETTLVFLPIDTSVEVLDIDFKLAYESKTEGIKEIMINPSSFTHNIQNLDNSFQKIQSSSPITFLNQRFINKIECEAILNEGLKIRSNFENFEFDVHNYGRNASKEAEFYGNIDEDFIRKSFLGIKNNYLERILNNLVMKDGIYTFSINVNFRILDKKGKRQGKTDTFRKAIDFTVKDFQKILRPRIDDMLNRKLLNILTSPEKQSEIITPTYFPINTTDSTSL